ncbi:MAG: metallophosphoesterase [bacterium]|nr:metallophosphoesterase [bacterium]
MRSFQILLGMLVASVAISGILGAHYYIATRLVLDPGVPAPYRQILIGGLVLLVALNVAHPIVERLIGPPLSRWVAWPASLWMGVFFLTFVTLGVSDLLIWSFGVGDALAVATGIDGSEGASRLAAFRALFVLTVVTGATLAGLASGLAPPLLERVEISLERWPQSFNGYRVVQISDIHIGPLLGRRFASYLVERCNALDPDLIVVTGDLVDGAVRHLEDEVAPFADLRARQGVYFVTGNHDHYSHAASWVECVERFGFIPLRNRHVTLGEGEARFVLAGVDDHRGGFLDGEKEDLSAALEGRAPDIATLLLAHDPSTFKRASSHDVDLQLSGHTHAGQIWPFRYLVRLAIPFVAGRYRRNGSELYVNRGTGFWGPPMRLFAPAEITEITLRSAPSPVR